MSTSSMHVAKTGLNAQQTRMQIIANNLANVSTTGFKRDRANFETLLYQVRRVAGDQTTAATNLTSSFSVGLSQQKWLKDDHQSTFTCIK